MQPRSTITTSQRTNMTYQTDSVTSVTLSAIPLPLDTPISDAKVFTGRQKPMTEVAMLFVELETAQGHTGIGFSYSKRAGGPPQYAHAKEVAEAPIGEDPKDIEKIYTKLHGAVASLCRSVLSAQALATIDVALYDRKATLAGLSLAKVPALRPDSVRTYITSGSFLNASIDEVTDRATKFIEEGIGGI